MNTISNKSSIQILPEDTPLIFQWLPKSHGSSVPNNENFPYLQRLVNWAEREPQRKIYLVVNGAGFKQGQIEKLREELKPASNIQVVDFQQVSKEVGFEHLKISRGPKNEPLELSELLMQMYDKKGIISYLGFTNILDAMRLEIIRNVEKITSREDAIYFDFDIFPKGNQPIGPVSIPKDILLPAGSIDTLKFENSIIGVNKRSQNVIKNMYKFVENMFRYDPQEGLPKITGYVYGLMIEGVQLLYYQEQGKDSIDHAQDEIPEEWYDKFCFEKNCGNIKVESDKSWKNDIYAAKELPLSFKNAQDKTITASSLPLQTITASALPYLNHVATTSTPVSGVPKSRKKPQHHL